MIFFYLEFLQISFTAFLAFLGAVVVALLWGITFHEFSHALAANSLGDPTPRQLGRLSFNPRAHLDPAGTLLLFIVGFGWGRPVPVNPYFLRQGARQGHPTKSAISWGPRQGMALVAAAGPGANLLTAAFVALPLKAGLVPWHTPFAIPRSLILGGWGAADYIGLFLTAVVIFNIILAVFNLIPLAPLDGFRVAAGALPRDLGTAFLALERYGPVILILLLVFPFVTGGAFSPIYAVMSPIINGLARLFIGLERDVI